ncbi:pyridoxal reductase [Skeletonema marinoi]|uniref:Pyridoxal reductase n=1 Tax=Skeletonema marinoi TaxID=267567 RepID=A0AAD8YEX0_9STRA|nr:pyridoxal reductase [Skeletonema marinoi]
MQSIYQSTSLLLLAFGATADAFSTTSNAPSSTDVTQVGSLTVPTIGCGTIAWSTDFGRPNPELVDLVATASTNQNGVFLDTGERYGSHAKTALGMGWGETECLVAKLLKDNDVVENHPSKAVVATKFTPSPWRTTMPDIVKPLRKFGFDKSYDKVYWDGLAECYNRGLVQNVGVSNYGPTLVTECSEHLAKRGVPLASNQIAYSLIGRHNGAQQTLDTCNELGVKVLAYYPFAMGLLTGKYTSAMPELSAEHALTSSLTKSRRSKFEQKDLESSTAAQYVDNMGALGWRLTEAEVSEMENVADNLGFSFDGAGFKRSNAKFVERWRTSPAMVKAHEFIRIPAKQEGMNMNMKNEERFSNKHSSTTPATLNTKTAQALSAGEFIFNTMIPQATAESTEVPLSSSPPEKNSNGLRMPSMDLKLQSVDFDFVPTVDGGVEISNAKPGAVTSSDFVAQNFLLSNAKLEPLNDVPRPRPLKLERVSTADSILKGNDLHDGRISSSDWKMGEFRDESRSAMKQLLDRPKPPCMGSLCSGMQRMSTDDGINLECTNIPNRAPPAGKLGQKIIGYPASVLTHTVPLTQTTITASSTRQSTKDSSSSTEKKSSKKKKKSLSVSLMKDVSAFREKALEFRHVYERSTKEEKYNISQILLEAVTSEGARFLERGQDGEWHQVIGNGARKKASQALRERMKGTPRRSKGAANLTSSVTSVNSVNSQGLASAEAYFEQEINGDTGNVYAV